MPNSWDLSWVTNCSLPSKLSIFLSLQIFHIKREEIAPQILDFIFLPCILAETCLRIPYVSHQKKKKKLIETRPRHNLDTFVAPLWSTSTEWYRVWQHKTRQYCIFWKMRIQKVTLLFKNLIYFSLLIKKKCLLMFKGFFFSILIICNSQYFLLFMS